MDSGRAFLRFVVKSEDAVDMFGKRRVGHNMIAIVQVTAMKRTSRTSWSYEAQLIRESDAFFQRTREPAQ